MEKFGDWELSSPDPLSDGFFGEVFEVWRYAPGTQVVQRGALKLLYEPDNPQHFQSLMNEIKAYATLNSAHIPRFLGTGISAKGFPWLVVEFIEGITLQKQVYSEGLRTREEVLQIGKEICQALVEAHSKNLKHLDIKSDNMMQRNSGEWVLLDFGLSTKQYQRGVGIRNHVYSAPEQFDTQATITSAADIFSLGATLYFSVAGQSPYAVYHGLTYPEAVRLKGPSLSKAPEDLRDLIGSMMHMQPELRPSASAVLSQINGMITGLQPVKWHADRIKSWSQLEDLVSGHAIKGADFQIFFTQPGGFHTALAFAKSGLAWAVSFPGEEGLGRVISPSGRKALIDADMRMERSGTFASTKLQTSGNLGRLAVDILKNGLEFSLAELSYKVSS